MGRIFFFFQAEDGIRDVAVTGVQTCALPICPKELQPERSETKFSEGSFPDSSVFSGLDSSLPIHGTGWTSALGIAQWRRLNVGGMAGVGVGDHQRLRLRAGVRGGSAMCIQ